jgi:hypothetical protein
MNASADDVPEIDAPPPALAPTEPSCTDTIALIDAPDKEGPVGTMDDSGKALLYLIPTDNIAATTTNSTTPQLLTVGSTLVYPYKTWFGDLYKLMCVPVSHLSPFSLK